MPRRPSFESANARRAVLRSRSSARPPLRHRSAVVLSMVSPKPLSTSPPATPAANHKPTPPFTSSIDKPHRFAVVRSGASLPVETSRNTLEVVLCCCDHVKETDGKLRDRLKLGIAFGTGAVAERGPHNEGMKNDGMISKLAELQCLEAQQQQQQLEENDVRGNWNCHEQQWTQTPRASDSDTRPTEITHPHASSTVLAPNPLLNARRTSSPHVSSPPSHSGDKVCSNNKAWAKSRWLGSRTM